MRCAICGQEAESLLWANHKELGGVWVCRKCWERLWEKNLLVPGSGRVWLRLLLALTRRPA
uniref:DUF4428 domain-containing protein n=1 Tax=Thermofilum pendens TaxID=2269 RepID=A0A7C3WPV4_THEPE